MKHLKQLCKTFGVVGLVLLCCALANAQLVRPRRPLPPEAVTKPAEKPIQTAPSAAVREAMIESSIRNVRVALSGQNVTISFSAFPNTVPIVELSKAKPKVGADRRWGFPSGSGSVARPAGGDKAKGEYTVDMNQELEAGATYYYIINATSEDGARRDQMTGQFSSNPANFAVRYRGFICEETTDGPGADEIYAIVSVSYVDIWTGPATSTGRHPHVTVEDVGNGDVHGDPGRNIYQGRAQNLLLTVTLMEHDEGNPSEYRNAVDTAVVGAFALLAGNHPQLFLTGPELGRAMVNISDAIQGVLGPGDDVIGTATRLITAEEMRTMANRPASTAQGIQYNFFTEHRGYGGVYRVYFDIIPQ